MTKKTKLELTWPGKEERPRLEPRILIEDPAKSYHAKVRREDDIFDNMLIKGDNLLALKALEQDFAGEVKCVFIDPPYNTGSAFTHYDDGLEHSLWLSLIRDRLEIIKRLLADDGSLWITIDDNEAHYLKILGDEVFGRSNFVSNVIWQKKFSPQNDAKWISASHDHVLCFAKDKSNWFPNPLPRSQAMDDRYKNPDNDPKGPWASTDITRAEHRDRDYWGLLTPAGKEVFPARGRSWSRPKANIEKLKEEGRLWFGPNGDRMPRLKKYLSEMDGGLTPQSIWPHDEVGHNQEAKKEIIALDFETVFDTPKPERLLQRILHLATQPGDLVLDSFAGSGTTGAVAHKMNRRWIMVEIGDHADTHIVPRLQKVIDGNDQGGISKAVDWKGGGGFRYFTLAPSLLEQDRYGNWVIAKDYNPAMLAEAMCKHMGFTYAPTSDPQEYWRHGASTETDFIYVTTQALTHEACARISHDVGPERSLLICCKAFDADADAFENLTLVKIPTSILQKCEWGRDDYSLNIQNLPEADDAAEEAQAMTEGLPLFAGEAGDE
ncbi:site-specific DNA-methyltransferase [Novosphingobium sp.]|uniref:site-specific DNA-methyltransferase n=1 Tax=Novosphingobium sp. TaxID=1874826 RepID=UPI0035B01F3A